MQNPLLDLTGLPPFSRIRPEHVEPAIDQLLQDCRRDVDAILEQGEPPDWRNLVEPLEEIDDRLSRGWSPVSHLNAVMNSGALREAYNACLPKLSDYATEMGQNETLYRAYRTVADRADELKLNPAQRKLLANAIRDFHLAGVDLEPDRKSRFKAIQQRLSQLTSQFDQQLLDATQAWTKQVDDPEILAGLPPSAIELAQQTAQQRGKSGWLLTLEFPSYLPVMTYADNRHLRKEVYEAYATRASDQGPFAGRWDNGPLMEEILSLRHELAQLLGFRNFAERSLATKMARNTEEVMEFLTDLARRSREAAEHEMDELRDFAREQHGVADLQAWDVAYYSEKLRQQKYAITQEELRPWFPDSRVLSGLFSVVEKLFGIQIREVPDVDRWHPDVRFFEIRDAHGDLCGEFYMDLYARQHKRGGAWMDDCVTRMFTERCDQLPVAYLTCNFSPPIGGRPALLSHDEVLTLFHEFGHGLHHMLTRVDYPAISGINGVAWDAVELPSQIMENWCWERDALTLLSGHYETGEPLPETLFGRMRAARNFQSAMQMVRQLEFALFDFRIHLEYDPARGGRIYEILEEVRDQVAVVRPPAFNRFAHGFSHIFSGGYAAGYYSYKWAEVLSSDAFSRFETEGIFNRATGEAFLHSVLEQGGSRDAMDLFVEFRGREPEIDALLRHSGIAA
jgi:oligopeptidase A